MYLLNLSKLIFFLSLQLTYSSISLHAASLVCMQFNKPACSAISLHAVQLACMQCHQLACSSISLHAVPLACMQFFEITKSSHAVAWFEDFLAIPSMQKFSNFLTEQLTRTSQCLLGEKTDLQGNFYHNVLQYTKIKAVVS